MNYIGKRDLKKATILIFRIFLKTVFSVIHKGVVAFLVYLICTQAKS